MAVRDPIVKLQAHAVTAGAKEAPTDATETNVRWPFSVCYPGKAKCTQGAGGSRKDIVRYELALHVNRVHLPIDIKTVAAFYDAFITLLIADPKLGGTVNTILLDEGIDMEFGKMEWAGIETLGMKFTIPCKMES